MKKLTKEQIETITANPILKEIFPELFKKELPETGFVKHIDGSIFYRKNKYSGFGINYEGEFIKYKVWSGRNGYIEATKEEFLEAMKPELKRRGFVDGVRVKSAYLGREFIFKSDSLIVCDTGNIWSEGFEVFFNGKFAEILPQFEVDQIGYAWNDRDEYYSLKHFNSFENGKFKLSSQSSKVTTRAFSYWNNFSIEEPNL